jgi:hypothetical protein
MLDGQVDVISRERIEGWLIDHDAPEQKPTLAILVDGHEAGRCRADLPRGTPQAADAAGRSGFAFEFKPPLSIFRAHRIEVRHADTGALLRNGAKTCACPANGRMPLSPILITSRGRAGTTLLMQEFVGHPDIVVADIYPYEIKLINYYASAYKVLVSHKYPGDGKEMDYVETARRFMTVGGNPFNNPGKHRLGAGESLAEIFEQDFPAQLGFLFRDTIVRYYRALSHTYRKPQARFFAEKSDIDADTRIGARMLLGEVREIVMIRDPRDFMCSAKAFWKMNTQEALDTVAYTTRRMDQIHAEQAPDTMFVRYEDLIQDPLETRRAICRFAGLDEPPLPDTQAGAALLDVHATSQSPERSIGRWESDLEPAEIAACEARFASFMARFGYAGAAPAGATPVAAAPVAAAPVAAIPVAMPPPRPAEPAAVVAYDLASFAALPGQAGRVGPGAEAPAFATTFGRDGDANRYQDAGWATGEHGYTWTNAARSVLHVPRPVRPGSYQVRAQLAPFVAAGRLAAQRVAVAVNGQTLGEASLARPSVLECRVGWDLLSRADPIRLAFAMPDAARPTDVTGHPNDSRLLGLSFQRLWLVGPVPDGEGQRPAEPARPETARPEPVPAAVARASAMPAVAAAPAKMMLRFESLGENCEFGLAQRRSGVEPLGLFRFASAPLPKLMGALAARFAGMGEPDHLVIEVSPNGREYMVFEKRFQFRYHAWVNVDEKTAEEVLAREARRLPFLVRKLLADLADGAKIFVFHGMRPLAEAEAWGLARAIRGFGPGTLLWVELADAGNPPGSVRWLGDGLLKGHMDRFAPGDNAHDISLGCWTGLCAAALEAVAQQPVPELARA